MLISCPSKGACDSGGRRGSSGCSSGSSRARAKKRYATKTSGAASATRSGRWPRWSLRRPTAGWRRAVRPSANCSTSGLITPAPTFRRGRLSRREASSTGTSCRRSGVPLRRLRAKDLDAFYATLRAGRGTASRPLKPSRIRRIHGVLRGWHSSRPCGGGGRRSTRRPRRARPVSSRRRSRRPPPRTSAACSPRQWLTLRSSPRSS